MTEKRYLKWYNKVGYGSGDIAGNVVYFTKFVSDISPGHHSESNLHTPVGHCR